MQASFVKGEHALRHVLHFLSYVALSLHTFVLRKFLLSLLRKFLLSYIYLIINVIKFREPLA